MKVKILFFSDDSIIPYGDTLTNDELQTYIDGPAFLTDINGKWYLEYDLSDGLLRILDVNNQSLSRELTTLKEQLAEYFNLTDIPERTATKDGLELELSHMGSLRQVITWATPEALMSEVCINDYNGKFSLLRLETRDFYTIESIDGHTPRLDTTHIPHEDLIVDYNLLRRKFD